MPGCVRVTACLLGEGNSQGSTKSFWFRQRSHYCPASAFPRGSGEGKDEGREGEEQHGKF